MATWLLVMWAALAVPAQPAAPRIED